MSQISLHHQRIVDNPSPYAPPYPDIASLGTSRVARKLRRKALDAYFVALRRYQGRPAKSGPPVANSEKRGRRRFYSLDQCRRGGRRSGETRRWKAEKKWREVCTLRRRGFGIRQIARVVGYTAGWVSQLVRRLLPGSGRPFTEHYYHQPQATDTQARPSYRKASPRSRALSLFLLHSSNLKRLLQGDPSPPDKARYERLIQSYRRRIVKYLAKIHEAAPGPKGVAETATLAMGFQYQRALSGMPIDKATRMLNSDFGWQN